MNAIEIKHLTKQFNTRTAVDDLSLEIREGEFFALLGQNGAGKTTTIKMLCCLTRPTSGDALIFGDSINDDEAKVQQKLNLSPQESAFAPNLTIRENLELIAGVYGKTAEETRELADRLMQDFKLTDRMKDKAKTLSGGYQRRLSIAMALVSSPKVLFLDEPTLGFDVRARRDLWAHLEAFKGKLTVVLTTHYLEEAEQLCDRIAIMDKGRIKALGTAQEINNQTGKDSLEDAFLSLTEAEQ